MLNENKKLNYDTTNSLNRTLNSENTSTFPLC